MRSKKAFYNITTNLILQFIVVIYGFIVPRMIIGSFGSNVNGLISSITQFLAYITLLESGFGPVVKSMLYKPISDKDHKTVANILKTSEKFFRTIAMFFLAYIILLCFLFPTFVSHSFGWFYTISLIIVIGISTFAEYFFGMTYRLYLQATQNAYVITLIQIGTYLLSVVSIIVLVKMNASIHIIKLVSGLIFVIRPLLQNYYVKRKFNINLKTADSNYTLKKKWDGLAQHIASVIHGNTDITILTIFSTLKEVSVYSVYYLVVKGLISLIQAFTGGIDATFGDMIARNEKDNLNAKFSMYEVIYNTISTIVFTSAIVLIVPFISVYTKGIKDVNYIRFTFGILLVISEYIWAIRLPYSSITLSAGHFRETRIGAWVECISNIIVSVILVRRFGIVGVTIGTITAMTIRTIEFVYHSNKHILQRSIWASVKKIIVVIAETLIIIGICQHLPLLNNVSYMSWIINAMIIALISTVVTISINTLVFYNEVKVFIEIIKNIVIKN